MCVCAVCCHSASAEEAVTKYVPGPVEVGPEIWVGAIAATIPFVIGSWEFAKRIVSGSPAPCRLKFDQVVTDTREFQLTNSTVRRCEAMLRWQVVQIIQRRCSRCNGSGLVMKGRYARKW